MFKSARWRSERNKIKAVFKLQFRATQVPQLGWETLMVSLVPVEVGKPTVRLEKGAVKDGTCRWENPIYETVKFVQEPKTGKINEKIYQFLVFTGSSKAGLLGEVSIDFADYVEAIKPSSISLPLKMSNSGAVLHVTIQRISGTDQREVEENGDVTIKSQDRSLKSQLINCDTDEDSEHNAIEDEPFNKTTSEQTVPNASLRASISSDSTLVSGTESSSGRNTPQELILKDNNAHQDPTCFLSSLSHDAMPRKPTINAITANYQEHRRSNTEWSVGSAPDGSLYDSTSSEDTLPRERLSQASDISIEKLKSDLVVFSRQVEVSELELQTLRKQIIKESKRGQELSKEVVSLKEEKEALKRECEQLKASKKHFDEAKKPSNKLQSDSEVQWTLLEEIRQELNYEKDLNSNLRLQLQKTQESNSELILAVQDLDEMLEQKTREISFLFNKSATNENAEEVQEALFKHEMDEDEEQAPKVPVKEQDDAKDTYLLEQTIIDLYGEIEVYRRDRDELEMQMEQLALDYEILKQENCDISSKLEQSQMQQQLKMQYDGAASLATINELETQVESLEEELKKQAKEFSTSLATISELETQVKSLEEELEKQAQGFEANLEAVTNAKVEQEQRAIQAEEALRKTMWNNANTAERLQVEFRTLSVQMASAFDANEKLAMKALSESSELRQQKSHLEEMLERVNEELGLVKHQYEAKMLELSNQIDLKTKQAEQMLLELEDRSMKLDHQKKQEEERFDTLTKEILMLKAEIERLTREKNDLIKQAEQEELRAEMEQMKTSIDKAEMLVQKGNVERDGLKKRIDSLMKQAEKSLEELNNMRCLKDEKETMVEILQAEVETLRAQYNDLKHSLFEDELEKENLRKQIFQLRGDLRKKEGTISITDKKLKDNSGRVTRSDGTKPISRNNKSVPVSRGSKEVANLQEKITMLEGQIKLKEAAFENSTKSFSEKEKDLHNKIEGLENRIEELSQNSTSSCNEQFEKESKDGENINANASKSEEQVSLAKQLLDSELSTKVYVSNQNGIDRPVKRTCSEKELKVSTAHNIDQENLAELVNEMALLKERNRSMEGELKEMQERYSEISLKFAEVEGERQQLVMTIRNLKNAKKI